MNSSSLNQDRHHDECESEDIAFGRAASSSTANARDESTLQVQPRHKNRFLRWIGVAATTSVVALTFAESRGERHSPHATGKNASLPDRMLSSKTVLSEQIVSRAHDVVTMARQLYLDDPTTIIPGAVVYTDEPDRALWVKKDSTCFAIFRSVTPTLEDWIQSLPLGTPVAFQSPLGTTCTAMEGYHRAYFDTTFVDQFRSDVHDCVSSCMDGNEQEQQPCDLIIGGASQGAGIAAVAAVDMEDLHPMLITAGQPPVLIDNGEDGPCTAIDSDRYFRFVNTAMVSTKFSNERRLQYDLVPSLEFSVGKDWLGNLIILSDNEGGLVQYPDNVRPTILPTMWNQDSHFIVNYLPRLESLKNSSVFPVPTNGWIDGSSCNFDSECQSDFCYNYKCVSPGSNGAPCEDNAGCISGRCSGIFSYTCREKLSAGAFWCTDDSDCLSDKCAFGMCQ